MAGLVKQVLAPVGTAVAAGQDVVLLESMKMEVAVPSEETGTVTAVRVNEGDFVNEGDVLLELE
jgi:acetyl-CoA carboxylase biotin carboxyl carrier protein